MNLFEKVAVVTGGDRGIGRAVVQRFVEEGAKVVIANRSLESGQKFEKELVEQGHDVTFIQTDVTEEVSVENLFKQAVEKYWHVDIVCASAGIARADTAETPLAEWEQTLDVNLKGVYSTNRFAILQMLKQPNGGAIVNLGSVHSFVANPQSSSYSVSKGGIKLLTQSFAAAYAKSKIRVNAVCPGYIETDMTTMLDHEKLKQLHPIGRLGSAEEVANAIMFLAGDEASFITGTSLIVDGGYSAI